jgi:hypothetical protein
MIIINFTSLPGGYSMLVPPDPISNSEVKRHSADDSVGSPHVKVGHCQVFTAKPRIGNDTGFFFVKRRRLYCQEILCLMDIVKLLPALLIFLLGLVLLGVSLKQVFFKRKLLIGGFNGTLGAILTISAVVALMLFMNLQTYVQLTRETHLADLSVGNRTDRGIPVSFMREGKTQIFWIKSAEWRVDARFLKWKSWVSILGKDPVVRLESFTGRMIKTGDNPDPIYDLSESSGIAEYLTTFLATHTVMADTLYGSSVYMPTIEQSNYRISATHAGLLARPINTRGQQAILDWNQ